MILLPAPDGRVWGEPIRAAVLEGRVRPLSRPLALAVLGRCLQARELFGSISAGDYDILHAETTGQDRCFREHGSFPRLQRAFVVHAIQFGLDSAVAEHGRGRFS